MFTTRRGTFAGLGAVTALAFLARCGAQNGMLDAQILADVQGLQQSTAALEAALQQYAPNALSAAQKQQIANLQAAVVAALGALTSTTPAPKGASALQTADADISQILAALGAALPLAAQSFPALAPFIPIFDAAVAIVPIVEAYVNTLTTTSAASAVVLRPLKKSYEPNAARAILNISIVK